MLLLLPETFAVIDLKCLFTNPGPRGFFASLCFAAHVWLRNNNKTLSVLIWNPWCRRGREGAEGGWMGARGGSYVRNCKNCVKIVRKKSQEPCRADSAELCRPTLVTFVRKFQPLERANSNMNIRETEEDSSVASNELYSATVSKKFITIKF